MKPDFSKIDLSYPEAKDKYSAPSVDEYPGLAPYTRGIHPSMYLHHPMEIWYQPELTDIKELNHTLKELIQPGAIHIQFGADDAISADDWKIILNKTDLHKLNPGFNSIESFTSFTDYCTAEAIDLSVLKGRVVLDVKSNGWIKNARNITDQAPGFKIVAEIEDVSDLGSIAANPGISAISQNIVIRLKASSFFGSIANMRAARQTWAKTLVSNEAGAADAKLQIDMDLTGSANDNDLVRSTIFSLASWMGGAQSITIPLSSNWENEAFINISRIIEEETRISHSMDAWGGSFYLEKITENLTAGSLT